MALGISAQQAGKPMPVARVTIDAIRAQNCTLKRILSKLLSFRGQTHVLFCEEGEESFHQLTTQLCSPLLPQEADDDGDDLHAD